MTEKVEPLTAERVLDRLRGEGLRITESRRHILEVLFEAKNPLSLQEIQETAGGRGGNPDYATVFRMMSLLEGMGLVHKVNLKRACSYYEIQDPSKHYDHVVCTECGKVVLIDMPCPLGGSEEFIASRYGFGNLTHSLQFFGECPDCLGGKKVA